MTHWDILWAFVFVGLALLAGKGLRRLFPVLTNLFLPSSVLGGAVALLVGPQMLGALAAWLQPGGGGWLERGLIPEAVQGAWRGLPGLLINVVFAALLLGKPIPGLREIWRKAGPQVAFGQTLAWGQYVVGIGLGLVVLSPFFGLPPMAGALIEIAFEGGHGTAAGMSGTFREMGFEAGADLALALATVGLVVAVVSGTLMVNWAARRGLLPHSAGLPVAKAVHPGDTGLDEDMTEEQHELVWQKQQELKPTDPLSIHLAITGMAIGIGWIFQRLLVGLEAATWARGGGVEVMRFIPLFPLAMLGGVLVQVVMDRTGTSHHINRRMMNRISGSALDFTIVAALGTLSIAAIRAHWAPLLLMSVAGLAWNLFGVFVIAPRLIPEYWFPRAVCDYGQSTGVTVTGLLLLRMADPANESGTLESFGYKQLLFEPIVGGGLFTAASVPLIVQFGPLPVLALTGGLLLFWLITGHLMFRHYRRKR
ncbi:MAG: sodium/glutamate symporter [Kiritimatiellia bacterium]|nr:sodium/glutamate symporter [Kiritimatiellia bacterium]